MFFNPEAFKAPQIHEEKPDPPPHTLCLCPLKYCSSLRKKNITWVPVIYIQDTYLSYAFKIFLVAASLPPSVSKSPWLACRRSLSHRLARFTGSFRLTPAMGPRLMLLEQHVMYFHPLYEHLSCCRNTRPLCLNYTSRSQAVISVYVCLVSRRK